VLPCGSDCAIVHTASPAEADALMALDDDAYRARLQAHFGERLHFASVGPRARYPLLLRYRPDPVGPRTVWLGNAAQTLHPVAGQGYNLALRDVWPSPRCCSGPAATPAPRHPGPLRRERRLDRQGTIRFTDGLVRLFSNAIAPSPTPAAPACSPSTCCRRRGTSWPSG
jgi:2-octaprenyl-6-methoxyphenol hydroxylase